MKPCCTVPKATRSSHDSATQRVVGLRDHVTSRQVMLKAKSGRMQTAAAPGPEAASASDDLVPRCSSTSLACKWFGFKKTDLDQNTVICKTVRKSIAVKQSSTTKLFHHLRTNHSKEYEEYEKLRDYAQEKTSTAQYTQQTLAACPMTKRANDGKT